MALHRLVRAGTVGVVTVPDNAVSVLIMMTTFAAATSTASCSF